MKKFLTLTALVACLSAQAACLPPTALSVSKPLQIATNENVKGCWVGWWCPSPKGPYRYVAAAKKSVCDTVKGRTAVLAFVNSKAWDVNALTFGSNPHIDPELRAVWEPDRAMLDSLKP